MVFEFVDPRELWNITSRPFLHWYEDYLISDASRILDQGAVRVRSIHIVGCGAGREIPGIRSLFPDTMIIASDISSRVLDICKRNLKRWECSSGVELIVSPAAKLPAHGNAGAELVVAMDNVLTYVTPGDARRRTFSALRSIVRANGLIVGVVHNRWGRASKSIFFSAQTIMSHLRITKTPPGDRAWRIVGHETMCHYFTRGELTTLLSESQFEPLKILSLSSLGPQLGRRYSPLQGDNNLVFIARAY